MNGVTIYSRNKAGKPLVWKASTDYSLNSDGYITIKVEYGQEGGKIQTKERFVKSRKES